MGVCLIQFFAPSCGGSGLPENKCFLNGARMPGFYTRRTLLVRVATTILANAAGFPVGREGPTVVIGSNVAFLICQRIVRPILKQWVDFNSDAREAVVVDEERFEHATRIACAVGGACGMAMIFNAPFGGLLYMFEEMTSTAWPWELTFLVFTATMLCTLISYGMLNISGHDILEFVIYSRLHEQRNWQWTDVPWFVVLAALLGLLTSVHTRGCLMLASWRGNLAKRPTGSSNLQYVQFNCEPGEYNAIASLLVTTSHSSVKLLYSGSNAGEIRWWSSIISFVVYFCLNVGLSGLPVPGGAFTATMLLGGLFGRCVGSLVREAGLSDTVSGVYAVVGSAAMLCGFKQMTLSVVLITVECVNDLTLAPVVMLSVCVSMAVNWRINRRGHDEEQIARKRLPFLEGDAPPHLDSALAVGLCDRLPSEAVLPRECPVQDARRALEASRDGQSFSEFPVVDRESGQCIGIVGRAELEAALRATRGGSPRKHQSRAFAQDPFLAQDDTPWLRRISSEIDEGTPALSLHRLMDPTPFTVLEDMPAPRLHALFARAGERSCVVIDRNGAFKGLVSRCGLIQAGPISIRSVLGSEEDKRITHCRYRSLVLA
ncbi:unnamed protein product [Prorocentrum cordatum]|uniref:Chloride channel protein n=1 Tax=Prorocentrum cordatum TaxID=2364126 RepID=A0ABN9UDY3_9DINO|nr:unnamed protein product [Polarella glacialis]